MLPLFEFTGLFPIFFGIVLILTRAFYFVKKYDYDFLFKVMCMALFTSITWLIFGYYYSIHAITGQFVIISIVYFLILIYLANCKKLI